MLPPRPSPLQRSHPCPSPPTRDLCLMTCLNFCVRPSGGRLRPQHIAKDCLLLSVGPLPWAPTYNRAWHNTWSCGVDMLPTRPSPLQRSHPCLSSTYMRSVKADMKFCVRPSGGRLPIATNYISDLFCFLFNFFLWFFKFSDQLLLRKRFLRKKVF